MRELLGLLLIPLILLGFTDLGFSEAERFNANLIKSFKEQSIVLTDEKVQLIGPNARLAVEDNCKTNSKIGFAAVDIADQLGLDSKLDSSLVPRIEAALKSIPCELVISDCSSSNTRCASDWNSYFEKVISLNQDRSFLDLVAKNGFSPVKISWEDIGRYSNSVWGDRISDVGIWVRRDEKDPSSAELALSVRRDENFRDKVLVVPSDKIKLHVKNGEQISEVSLAERLNQLGLESKNRDRNVIVSNQFAIVPVPPKSESSKSEAYPPRAAFNFSIFPYGSTNYVITDVIEGSSDAIVGAGNHQLLYANIDGQKAPFTASRANERKDLVELEANLKGKGMDVDVQRYYLIQIPLKKNAVGITLSNMGNPPFKQFGFGNLDGSGIDTLEQAYQDVQVSPSLAKKEQKLARGVEKVAIGHGDLEGQYVSGGGYRGQRADEPIRVTVVYFVTPSAKITAADMQLFADTFKSWDSKALWEGSFVTKDS